MKKTFILYVDWIDYTTDMNLEEKGLFFQTILRYNNGEDIGEIGPIKFIWSRVKKQIDEDNEKWNKEIENKKFAGKVGGIKSGEARRSKMKQNEADEAPALKMPKNEANEAVNVNVNNNIIKNNNIILKKDNTIVLSKKTEAKENSFEEADIFFEKLKEEIKTNEGVEPELIKFYNYWTAPMKSGKIYWTSQKTFAFRSRLRNWLEKTNKNPNIPNFINNKPARGTVG